MIRLSNSSKVLSAAMLVGISASYILHAAEPAADPAKITAILGPNAVDQWTITPAVVSLSEEPAIVAPAGITVVLSSKAVQPVPGEYIFAFRLKPAKGGSANISLQLGCGERPDKTQQALNFSVGLTSGQPYVTYATSVQGGNGRCEKFIGTIKQECLSRFIVFGKKRLDYLVSEFTSYYNHNRAHSGRDNLPPIREVPSEVAFTLGRSGGGPVPCRGAGEIVPPKGGVIVGFKR